MWVLKKNDETTHNTKKAAGKIPGDLFSCPKGRGR
jgi:hypothetical protein